MNKFLKELFQSDFDKIPKAYIKRFFEEKLVINLVRGRIYACILAIWTFFMLIYLGLGACNGAWERIPAYKYEFYIQLIGLLISSIFIWLFLKNKADVSTKHNNNTYILNFCFITFVIIWTTVMTVNDLSINQQMIVYTIGIMAVSISFIMSPRQVLMIYVPAYIILVTGTLLTQVNRALIDSSILNGLILVVLGTVITKMIFSLNVKDFIKSIEIEEKNEELKDSYKVLEIALDERTKELAAANEQLVQEINSRHEIEIQALRADLEYQKKVTELNKAMEYDKLRGEFFANISHELRTPLNIIFCSLQMISGSLKDNPEMGRDKTAKYMKMMKQNCYRLLRLINNIIDITKIDSGYLSIDPRNKDIVQIVENITMSVVPFAEYKGCSVIFDTEMEEKVIACDPDKIERIIMNLLSNAIKFTGSNGIISVNMYERMGYVVINVKDTGIGIPKDKQKAVFDRFIQVDKSITRKKEGSGIGLSLVKSLVEMHNGRIGVVSEPGKGSEFIVELPDVTVECDEESCEYISNRVIDNAEVINIEFSDIYS